jgi:PAS domain S-box-containing protein
MPPRLPPAESIHSLAAHLALHGHTLALPLQRLFDDLPNVVFFIKDRAGRYVAVNRTLVERCGFADKSEVLGKLPSELFPAPLAAHYERQDRRVLQSGRAVLDQLELHFYPNRRRGWCLTNKYPIPDAKSGAVAAVAGLSRDVESSARGAESRGFPELARALDALQSRIGDPPGVAELAAICRVTPAKFSRLTQRVFGLTPRQLALKVRLDEALHLLATTDDSLADIAGATGFCDQSAFTRHFRRLAGLPPGVFRARAISAPLR